MINEDFKKLPLTYRMSTIVSMVDNCDTVFDIACDHGYVGLEILKQNKAKKVVFSDIKEAPLMQAKKNLDKYCKNIDNILYEFRVGDGLKVIHENEKCDTAIIAGIGYDVMVSILDEVGKYDIGTIIVSSHSKVEKFKKYLIDNNYNVVEEKTVVDKDKIYYIQKIKIKGTI